MNKIHPTANLYGKFVLGNNTSVGAFCDIGGKVGQRCKIQCHVSIPPHTLIGDDVFIGPGARFANDRLPNLERDFEPNGTYVEDKVVIGMGALIGAGLKIGKGAIIGMGAVVTKDVPAGEVWVGNPAKALIQDITE